MISAVYPAALVALAWSMIALPARTSAEAAERDNPANIGLAEIGFVKEQPPTGPFVKTGKGFMVPYKLTIPGTDVAFEMVPIPGGKFRLGSPATEKDRRDDEGPQAEIEIEPFWMGKYEVTWGEYRQFMALYDVFKDFDALRTTLDPANRDASAKRQRERLLEALKTNKPLHRRLTAKRADADAVTAPTKLYDPSFTFENGDDPRLPAVTMTQYAARQYTKWLSGLTSHVYRLPGEAEWEYACRAGTTTAYHFGDDVKKLGEYAWYFDNSDEKPHLVGKKQPNPWGLFDMHGNVAEWVLDEHAADTYKKLSGKTASANDAIVWPTKLYPRVLRGGSWEDDALELRSAARKGSEDKEWNIEDPNRPKSPWWFTNDPARGVGFRVVRMLTEPKSDAKAKYWDADVDSIRRDVAARLKEGRGIMDVVDPSLAEAVKQLQAVKKEEEKNERK